MKFSRVYSIIDFVIFTSVAISVRDQMGGSPEATRLNLMSREEKRENQVYWNARIGYGTRWLV